VGAVTIAQVVLDPESGKPLWCEAMNQSSSNETKTSLDPGRLRLGLRLAGASALWAGLADVVPELYRWHQFGDFALFEFIGGFGLVLCGFLMFVAVDKDAS